jgi:hypothetical protein
LVVAGFEVEVVVAAFGLLEDGALAVLAVALAVPAVALAVPAVALAVPAVALALVLEGAPAVPAATLAVLGVALAAVVAAVVVEAAVRLTAPITVTTPLEVVAVVVPLATDDVAASLPLEPHAAREAMTLVARSVKQVRFTAKNRSQLLSPSEELR